MPQYRTSIALALSLMLIAGCQASGPSATGIDGGGELDASAPDGGDAGGPPDAGRDAGSEPDADGVDAGTDAGPGPYVDYGKCELEQALAFVNDPATSAGMLRGSGLTWDQANDLDEARPFEDVRALDAVLGSDAEAWATLVDAADDDCPLEDGEPQLRVQFTDPQCDPVEAHDVPAGVRCYGDEVDDSLWASDILDPLLRWIDMTRRAKETNPERDVRIVMAFLSWSNSRLYDKICEATAAGVQFEGFFDRGAAGTLPPRLAEDADCAPENVEVSYLGGVTDYPDDWRLMHVKMMLFDTGGPTTRLAFGSANASTYGMSLHHEGWLFGRFPRESHFAQAHACAAEALRADRYADGEADTFPDVFDETYTGCVDEIEATADSRYRVLFTRSDDVTPEAVSLVESAEETVDVAIQHFSSRPLVEAVAAAGGDADIATRLLLDDDTFYGVDDEEGGNADQEFYEGFLKDSGADIRFLQTNGHLDVGAQYQHNKAMVADGERVFFGAGNFTVAAFEDNYENFYVFDDPEVATAFAERIETLHGLAAAADDLPEDPAY